MSGAKQEGQEKPLRSPDKLRSRYGKFLDLDRDLNRYTCKFEKQIPKDKKTILKNEARYWRDHFERDCKDYKQYLADLEKASVTMSHQTDDTGPATNGPPFATVVAPRRAVPPAAVPPIIINLDDDEDDKENEEELQPRRGHLLPPKTPDLINTIGHEQKQALTPPPTNSSNDNNCKMGSPAVFHISFGNIEFFGGTFLTQGRDPHSPDRATSPLSRPHGPDGADGRYAVKDVPRPVQAMQGNAEPPKDSVDKKKDQRHGPDGADGLFAVKDVLRPAQDVQGNAEPPKDSVDKKDDKASKTGAGFMLEIVVKDEEDPNTVVALINGKSHSAKRYFPGVRGALESVFHSVGTTKYYATFFDEDLADQTRLFLRRDVPDTKIIASV